MNEIHKALENFATGIESRVEVDCPFCQSSEKIFFDMVGGCKYVSCRTCCSIYASPRINQEDLTRLYALDFTGDFSKMLDEEYREVRKELMFRPRWELLKSALLSLGYRGPYQNVMEVGAGIGYFLEVLNEDKTARQYFAVEPSLACVKSLEKLPDTRVINTLLEDVDASLYGQMDLVFINSVIEHPFSLEKFFKVISKLIAPNGFLVMVDMNAIGFDLQLLRGQSQNFLPYLVNQIGSPSGILSIAEHNSLFMANQISIGQLDTDIVYQYAKNLNDDHPMSGFSNIFTDEVLRQRMQSLLAKHFKSGYIAYIFGKR